MASAGSGVLTCTMLYAADLIVAGAGDNIAPA
jgi:hypothetical protein